MHLSKDELDEWLDAVLWHAGAPKPTDTYFKGDMSDFNGVMFGKYTTKADGDATIKKVRLSAQEFSGQKLWAKRDQPLEDRVVESVLFGAKKMLVDWRWNKQALWVDLELKHLSCGGDIALTVGVEGGILKIDYGAEWEAYIAKENEMFTSMIQDANSKLVKQLPPTKASAREKMT